MPGKHEAQKKTNISKELKVSASTFSYPFLWLSLGFLYNRSLLVYLRLSSSTLNKKNTIQCNTMTGAEAVRDPITFSLAYYIRCFKRLKPFF